MTTSPNRIALAYSGGLDTSVMIPWLRRRHDCEVVAVVVDVGQEEDLSAVRRKALESGAVECRVVDVRRTFIDEYVFSALRAGAVYEGRYLLGTALARPLIARAQVRVARETACDALAHGCTGKGNDQVRFELAYGVLAPDLAVVAPWREWDLRSRSDALEYADRLDIPVAATRDRPFSVDRNLWHTSFEGGVLEDPGDPAPADLRDRVVDPREAPDRVQTVEIRFERGTPTAIDGEPLPGGRLVQRLNELAGAHGVGREDLVENRVVGMKSRGVYETPAGTVLTTALRDLEALTLDRDTAHYREDVSRRYSELVYEGHWYSPLRRALDAFVTSATSAVTGIVEMELYQGSCRPVARSSPHSLYREELATFGEDGVYDQRHAEGFIRLYGLQQRVHASTHGPADDAAEATDGPSAEDAAGAGGGRPERVAAGSS